jgi:hypothetical protein
MCADAGSSHAATAAPPHDSNSEIAVRAGDVDTS